MPRFIEDIPVTQAPCEAPMKSRFDLTSPNANMAIVLSMDLLFFLVAVFATVVPAFASERERLWTLFLGTNTGLFLALRAGGGHTPTPPGPTAVGA